ncbi:hypothetical protein REPUB_Repub07fG0139300 [Reevesia pubescens]
MALRAGRSTLDQNLNVHYYNGVSVGGQKNASNAPKKGLGTAGRKPLGDLSNSANPLPKLASIKQNTKVFSIADKETTATPKIPFDANKKKSLSNASQRVQTGARKALSDISNSTKPCVRENAEKNRNAKQQSVVIEEECFLHNHQECIEAQKSTMHRNEFLQMLGLDKDFSGQSALSRTPPMSNKKKPQSPLKNSEPLEMAELLIEDQYPLKNKLSSKLVSPSATRTPEPPNHFLHWADHDCLSYSLIETP